MTRILFECIVYWPVIKIFSLFVKKNFEWVQVLHFEHSSSSFLSLFIFVLSKAGPNFKYFLCCSSIIHTSRRACGWKVLHYELDMVVSCVDATVGSSCWLSDIPTCTAVVGVNNCFVDRKTEIWFLCV